VGIVLLVSGKAPHWRAVAPLGVDATIPGIEGSRSTNVEAVKLASGQLALAVDTQSGGGGDCDQSFEKVSVLTLSGGKLIPMASFVAHDIAKEVSQRSLDAEVSIGRFVSHAR